MAFQPMPSSSAKLISTLLLLLGSAVAQTQPFASQVSAGTWQGKNAASKEILAYVIEFESPHTTIVAHDYYFKLEGVAPGTIEAFDVKASERGSCPLGAVCRWHRMGGPQDRSLRFIAASPAHTTVGNRNGQRLLPRRGKEILGLSGVQQRSGWLRQTRLDHATADRNRRRTRPPKNPAGFSREARQDVGGWALEDV
jgi:hypothetical protein